MRRGNLDKKSIINIILVAIFTIMAFLFDQLAINTEDKIRNEKIIDETLINKLTKMHSISDYFDNLTIESIPLLQPIYTKRNIYIKSLIMTEQDKNFKNYFNTNEYEDPRTNLKYALYRTLLQNLSIAYDLDLMLDFYYVNNKEIINELNKDNINLNNIFNAEDYVIEINNTHEKVLKLVYDTKDSKADDYRFEAYRSFTTEDWFSVYKLQMTILKGIEEGFDTIGKFTGQIEKQIDELEIEEESVFKNTQTLSIRKNYFILLSILSQIISLLALLFLFKNFLINRQTNIGIND